MLLLQDDPPAHPPRRVPFDRVLQTAINRYLKQLNDDPKPFVWTKPADVILAKLDPLPAPSV